MMTTDKKIILEAHKKIILNHDYSYYFSIFLNEHRCKGGKPEG